MELPLQRPLYKVLCKGIISNWPRIRRPKSVIIFCWDSGNSYYSSHSSAKFDELLWTLMCAHFLRLWQRHPFSVWMSFSSAFLVPASPPFYMLCNAPIPTLWLLKWIVLLFFSYSQVIRMSCILELCILVIYGHIVVKASF